MEDDKLTLNQLMILSMYLDRRSRTQEIAEELSMTKQGVLYHVKALKTRGLIDDEDHITSKGYEILHEGLSKLREYLSESLGRLETALTWEAIADEPVDEGQKVYLTMREGYMHASKQGVNTASGIAVSASDKNGLLLVEDISGTVNMSVGAVKFYVIGEDGKTGRIGKPPGEYDLSGAIGEAAHIYCRDHGIEATLEFGALEGAFDACTRGMDVRVFVSGRRFRFTIQKLGELSRLFPRVSYSIEYI